MLIKTQVHSSIFLTCFSGPPRRTSCSCFKKSCLVLCRIFVLLPDLFFPLSAKIPIVFFSAFLKSKYLVMDFSPWHPTVSPNYCGVFISLIDINQFCRKTALPSRQAPAPGLAQHIWYCQWRSLCESLGGDALTGRTWEAIRKYFPWPGSCTCTRMMLPFGFDIHKARSAFQRGGITFCFSRPSPSPLPQLTTTLESFITQTLPSHQ